MSEEGGELPCMAHLVDDDGHIADDPAGGSSPTESAAAQQPAVEPAADSEPSDLD